MVDNCMAIKRKAQAFYFEASLLGEEEHYNVRMKKIASESKALIDSIKKTQAKNLLLKSEEKSFWLY